MDKLSCNFCPQNFTLPSLLQGQDYDTIVEWGIEHALHYGSDQWSLFALHEEFSGIVEIPLPEPSDKLSARIFNWINRLV
jgi:hypothetical protein